MARLISCGLELQSVTTGVEIDTIVGSPTIDTSVFRSGLASLKVNPTAASHYASWTYRATAQAHNTYVRAYMRFASFPTANSIAVLAIRDATNGNNLTIRVNIAGTIFLNNEQTSTQIGSTSSALSTNTWYRIEISYVYSTGAATAAIDGAVFATGTANATLPSNTLRIGAIDTATINFNIDDIAVNDEQTGGTQTGLPGAGAIVHVHPNAAGDSNTYNVQVGGTLGSANNFTRVDEVTPDDLTTYNASNTVGQSDLFKVGSSGAGATDTINVVSVGGRFADISLLDNTTAFKFQVEKASAGTISLSAAIDPDTATFNTNNISARACVYPIILYLDPDGSSWTSTTLGTMQIGYQLTTANVNAAGVSTVWALIDSTPAVIVNNSGATTLLMGV